MYSWTAAGGVVPSGYACPARLSRQSDGTTNSAPLSPQGSHGPDRITRNEYDLAGQLLRVRRAWGTPLQQDHAAYTYSLNGRRTSVTDANGNVARRMRESSTQSDLGECPHCMMPED
jgi:YD repeat-containing protein